MIKQGVITPNGVELKEHELSTIVYLTSLGHDIELIPKSNQLGVRTPDILMDGLSWEIKSPKGEGKSLMKNTIQKAVRQSENVVIDLRRTKRYQDKCLSELEREFNFSTGIKRLKIITKSKKIIDFVK